MREILFNFSDQKLSQLLNFSLTNKLILKILLSKEISFDNHSHFNLKVYIIIIANSIATKASY